MAGVAIRVHSSGLAVMQVWSLSSSVATHSLGSGLVISDSQLLVELGAAPHRIDKVPVVALTLVLGHPGVDLGLGEELQVGVVKQGELSVTSERSSSLNMGRELPPQLIRIRVVHKYSFGSRTAIKDDDSSSPQSKFLVKLL